MTKVSMSSPKSLHSFRQKSVKTLALGNSTARSSSSLKRANNMAKEACSACRRFKKKCVSRPDALPCEECMKHGRLCIMEGSSRSSSYALGNAEMEGSATPTAEAGDTEWEDDMSDTASILATSQYVSTRTSLARHCTRSRNLTITPTPSHVGSPSPSSPEAYTCGVKVISHHFVTIERSEWFGHNFNHVAPISNARADEDDVPAWGQLRLVVVGQDDNSTA